MDGVGPFVIGACVVPLEDGEGAGVVVVAGAVVVLVPLPLVPLPLGGRGSDRVKDSHSVWVIVPSNSEDRDIVCLADRDHVCVLYGGALGFGVAGGALVVDDAAVVVSGARVVVVAFVALLAFVAGASGIDTVWV